MKKLYTLAGVLFMAGASYAQAPYMTNNYVYAPTEKHAPHAITTIDGRKVDEGMDREVYYSENFDAGFGGWVDEIQEGSVGFKLTDTGHENDPANTFQIPVLETSTPTQWVLVDSDGDGTSYANPEEATLTSPELDLSDAAGSFVALTFEQFFAEWQPAETSDHCYVGISTDGTTFTEVEINEGVGREARPNPEYISWDITDLIAGSESSIWIRFRWEGAWNYGWQIDNIQIEDINESDLMLVDTYRSYDGGIVYSQVAEVHAAPMVIGAIIKNIGHIEQTNIKFDYVITGPDGSEVASGTSTETIASLNNSEQDTILEETGYTPDAIGTYTVEWTAVADDADDNEADNVTEDGHFQLTEHTMALDYDEGPAVEIGNWPLKTGEAYFGNLMTFQAADVATAMQVMITDYEDNLGEQIKVAIWEFPEGGAEWTLVYDSDDHTIVEADLGNMITFDLEEFDVNETSTYMFCGYQYSSGPQPIFVRQGDIGFNNVQGRDDEFNNRGFFDRRAPIIRVRLFEGEVGVAENEKEYFGIYPNPATDAINVSLSLNDSENTVVRLIDITGKTVEMIQLGAVNGSKQVALGLDNLTPGIYFIELNGSNGKQVKKFVKK